MLLMQKLLTTPHMPRRLVTTDAGTKAAPAQRQCAVRVCLPPASPFPPWQLLFVKMINIQPFEGKSD